jgi:predicted CXXCH cytochrome family protein
MTKRYLLAGSFVLLLILGSYFGTIKADITGSMHDFSSAGWNPGGEICEPCHTPHNADLAIIGSPLWNHEETTASFTIYSSPTLVVTPEQPRGPSKLCLSCHDGTVSLDSFGGNIGSTFISGPAKIGTVLSDDHPVSIKWEHQNDIGNQTCANCHNVHDPSDPGALPFFGSSYPNVYVECSTCHDVHNSTVNPKLLRLPMQGSQLCLHCHGK